MLYFYRDNVRYVKGHVYHILLVTFRGFRPTCLPMWMGILSPVDKTALAWAIWIMSVIVFIL